MTPQEYITQERAKGTPESQIHAGVQSLMSQQSQKAPAPNQRSFAEEMVPAMGSVAGGFGGGIIGAAFGGVGAVPGAIAGAGLGGAAGEALQQKIEKSFNLRNEYDPTQIATTGITDAALQATGEGFLRVGAKTISAAREPMIKILSKFSGYADGVLQDAFAKIGGEISPAVKASVVKGEQVLTEAVKKVAHKLSDLADRGVKEARATVSKLGTESVAPAKTPGLHSDMLSQGRQFMTNIIHTLENDHNIVLGLNPKTGEKVLSFSGDVPSRIVSGTDQGAIRDAFFSVQKIMKDASIKNINAVLERLITLETKTPAGSATGPQTKMIIRGMAEEVKQFVDSLGSTYGEGYAKYGQFLKDNLAKRMAVSDAQELFGASKNLTSKEVDQIKGRLLSMYNLGKGETKTLAGKVGEMTGVPVRETTAGTTISAGQKGEFGGQHMIAKSTFLTKVAQWLPEKAVKNYLATGQISGELLNNKALNVVAKTIGVPTKVLVVDVINLMQNKTENPQ